MIKRKLKRQLSLAQVVMLGTAGAIGAEIFVLTGYAAGLAGPALVLALLIGGLLSYSIALNYGELASSFPVTGGALTYVREAWGTNLLSYLVGSLDCLSSTFYSALSAVGFAYSLQIFLPFLPIVPTAIGIILVFVALNILGVGNIGNLQIVLGGILLLALLGYIFFGLALPGGFDWNTFLPDGRLFIQPTAWSNISALLTTVALAYVAFIGFEVIADDAEEVKDPDRNILRGILISLTLCLILYPLIAMVTLGVIPWTELAGSGTALTDAAARFLPTTGPTLLGIAGIIATLTTLNSAMLSATREAFTMSREGMWPRFLSRLGRFRTPYIATLVIGAIICAVAAIGLVDFLSYISSSGYLFVLFWSNLAMIRLRKRYPDLRRPFKAPFFPLTAYLAMGTCLLIISFSDPRALLFGAGLLALLTLVYYLTPVINRIRLARIQSAEKFKNRILVPVSDPAAGVRLIHLAAILAQAIEDTSICVFHVNLPNSNHHQPAAKPSGRRLYPASMTTLPDPIVKEVRRRNVPIYMKNREAGSIAMGILEEADALQNVKLILCGWPGPLNPVSGVENPVKLLLEKAQTNVTVLRGSNLGSFRHILVPIGGGVHSRLALRLAYEIAVQENAKVTVLRTYAEPDEAEEVEDEMLYLRQIVAEELGGIPARVTTRVALSDSVISGILEEMKRNSYDLLAMGASEEWGSGTRLFGSVDDWIVEHIRDCTVLLARVYEPIAIHWLRRYLKRMSG
ncbi:MAG: amino acid permease [Anaerolineales bacterium]|nr:amino acid permease [Anaerolineales bacterium]